MFPPFPEEEALSVCHDMIEQLESGFLELKQVSAQSQERANHGIMLGVLVCKDLNGNKINLKTLSGISKVLTLASGLIDTNSIYVPPIVLPSSINAVLKKNDEEIHLLTKKIKENFSSSQCKNLIAKRTLLTTESLLKVHSLYSFCCADKKVRSLNDICKKNYNAKFPPTGTGDCCAPKLLHYAFSHNLTPLSMCEVFYGNNSEKKESGKNYPPCNERCSIILPTMLGLEILYQDKDIIVVNKQSGLLSVPGRGIEKQDCIVNRVKRLFPSCIEQPAVHRLDMETSGLLVLAFTKEAHRSLSKQFEEKKVFKEYVALLDGVLAKKGIKNSGTMELYFRLDVENRPHQIWDSVYGKKAITQWKVLNVERYNAPDGSTKNVTRVLFTPLTGRTHQLRLASADSHGFAVPIIGDSLYGTCQKGERLMLHAQYLEFTHPTTQQKMTFTCNAKF